MADKSQITAEYLRQLFQYEPETGIVTRRITITSAKAGDIVGCPRPDGYLRCSVKGRGWAVHHIAWAVFHGEIAPDVIDHINGVRDDNRIANLRLCDRAANHHNRVAYPSNSTGYKGIFPSGKKFRAAIRCRNQRYNLGTFDTAEAAHAAYCEAGLKLHGEFFNSGKWHQP